MAPWTAMPVMTLLQTAQAIMQRPFRDATPDLARRAKFMVRAPAKHTLAILFTPRSGSSRLTEILGATRMLGHATETFNPVFMPRIARAIEADRLENYIALLRRTQVKGGVFSCELTCGHLLKTFRSHEKARAMLQADAWVWLIREDIVAQAISSVRKMQTRIAHDTGQIDPGARAAAEAAFRYDARAIRSNINRIRWSEIGTEQFLAGTGASPLRLGYERLSQLDPADIARLVAAHLGVTLPATGDIATTHRKLGTDKNQAFAERFRAEHPRLIARLQQERAPLVAALTDLPSPAQAATG